MDIHTCYSWYFYMAPYKIEPISLIASQELGGNHTSQRNRFQLEGYASLQDGVK